MLTAVLGCLYRLSLLCFLQGFAVMQWGFLYLPFQASGVKLASHVCLWMSSFQQSSGPGPASRRLLALIPPGVWFLMSFWTLKHQELHAKQRSHCLRKRLVTVSGAGAISWVHETFAWTHWHFKTILKGSIVVIHTLKMKKLRLIEDNSVAQEWDATRCWSLGS